MVSKSQMFLLEPLDLPHPSQTNLTLIASLQRFVRLLDLADLDTVLALR
jgi:hypothetical protein